MPAISKDYSYSLTQSYNYDDTLVTIDAGRAELYGTASGTLYATSSPTIDSNETLIVNSINSFTETFTSNGTGDMVRYIMTVDGQGKYWDGAAWSNSNGSYLQANVADDIQANSSTITSNRARIKVKSFLHSSTGLTTPYLSNLNISYNFTGYSLIDDVRGLLIGVDSSDLKDEEIVTYIEVADTTIDFYVGVQNTLPITDATALKLLRSWSMVLASYNVYVYLATKQGVNVAKLATSRYEKLIEVLESIADGSMFLTNLASTDKIDISTYDYSPTFNQGDVESWGTDPDLLEDISDGSFYG